MTYSDNGKITESGTGYDENEFSLGRQKTKLNVTGVKCGVCKIYLFYFYKIYSLQ